jgi:hypothetical protein
VETNTRKDPSTSLTSCDLNIPHLSGQSLRVGTVLLLTAAFPGADAINNLALVVGPVMDSCCTPRSEPRALRRDGRALHHASHSRQNHFYFCCHYFDILPKSPGGRALPKPAVGDASASAHRSAERTGCVERGSGSVPKHTTHPFLPLPSRSMRTR